jgi:hypothetical protein
MLGRKSDFDNGQNENAAPSKAEEDQPMDYNRPANAEDDLPF